MLFSYEGNEQSKQSLINFHGTSRAHQEVRVYTYGRDGERIDGYLFLVHGDQVAWTYSSYVIKRIESRVNQGHHVWLASCYPDRCLNSSSLPKGVERLYPTNAAELSCTTSFGESLVEIKPKEVDAWNKALQIIGVVGGLSLLALSTYFNVNINVNVNVDVNIEHQQ